jgi:hypothetical protein
VVHPVSICYNTGICLLEVPDAPSPAHT